MRTIYQSMWIELPYEVIQITDIKMNAGKNSHAVLEVVAVCEDEKRDELLNQPVEEEKMQVGFLNNENANQPFFSGIIKSVVTEYDRGQFTLKLTASSMTQKWDIIRRRRTFQNLNSTYDDIIGQVLSAYSGSSWISNINTSVKIPGLLLQYDETDWEFLCRLASHFEAYILEEPAGEAGQIYFGLPEMDQGNQIESNFYQIFQDMEKYQTYAENIAQGMMLQDNLGWNIISRKAYKLGEKVRWKQVSCQITSMALEVSGAEILYTYVLERAEGVKARYYGNPRISGLSLPATIKERSGNLLRVHFLIDPEYKPGNNVYFTYAIETTSWYCLPEVGSTVHIYFQNWDETTGIAIHAMRLGGAARAGSVSAKGAISDKSFSTSDGKAMKFTDTGISFVSDEAKASSFTMSKDGSLNMVAQDITLMAELELNLGKGTVRIGKEMQEIIPQNTMLKSENGVVGIGILNGGEEELVVAEDKGIQIDNGENIWMIASAKLTYEGEQKDPPGIQYSDAELKAEDAQQREAHNAEVFEVRENESEGKIGVGAAIAGLGLICLIGAATVCTGGAALVAVGTGVTAYMCGIAQMDEGFQDLSKMESGDFSQSFNAVRDGMLGGKQDLYDMVMYGSVMIGLGAVLAPLAGTMPVAAKGIGLMVGQMVTAGALSTGVMYLQDVTDGYVDGNWSDYLKKFALSSAITGIGFGIGSLATGIGANSMVVNAILTKAGKFAPALIIGAETGIDVAADWATSELFGLDFDLSMSLLTALGSNIAFSIDPVNMATGGFCLAATDMLLPDLIDENFDLQRIYNSVISCTGSLGKNWMLGLESRLFIRKEEGMIDVICMDGHAERFCLEEGEWKNRRQGDRRYQLKEQPGEEGFFLLYIPEQKRYYYDSVGRLLSVQGKGPDKLTVHYQESHISQVVTSAGCVLEFQYEGERITEIRDEMDRKIRYKYEGDCLKAVCHVDEGVTTYHYDDENHITQVIDQNGHAYVRNEYDGQGRVIAQYYPDGTKSTILYDPKKRENTVYIESLGRTERYQYNRDSLVTHTYFDDGSFEETGYDQWTNRIYEKDRNGNETHRLYSEQGLLLRETLPSGQSWEYHYQKDGCLLEKRADTGEEIQYVYDASGFETEKREKIAEGKWKNRKYERDSHGRVVKETDSRGNITTYRYADHNGKLLTQPSGIETAVGDKIFYEFDKVGRKTSIRNNYGTAELRYNLQNYPTYVTDGNGNELRRTYDKMGNLTALFPPNQGTDGTAWMYRYDFFDRLIEARDPDGNSWKKERNLAGDILREVTPEGCETRYEYDTDSRRLRTIYPDGSVERCFYDGNGNLIKKVRPENYHPEIDDGLGSIYEYDCMNRLIRITDEDGQVTESLRYDRSGNLIERTDEAGYTSFYVYDYAGNRTEAWEPVEKAVDEVLYRITLYEYDTESNKIRERKGLDKVKAGEYARRYRELLFTYDELNRMTCVKDRHGAKAIYQYDCLNHKTYESFQISKDVVRIISYVYDAAGNQIERREGIEERFLKPGGRQKIIWAVTHYEYDRNGNCVRTISPKGYERNWEYDVLDRIISQEEKDEKGGIHRAYVYEYDGDGKLLSRTDKSVQKETVRRFGYDIKGRLTHLTDEIGATTRLFYDRNDRIARVVRPEQYDGAADDGAGTIYAYDCRDRVIELRGTNGVLVQKMVYDPRGNLHSLLEGESVYTEYDYDLLGNPTAIYKGWGNVADRKAAQRFSYDAWGNVTAAEDGNQNRTDFVMDDWGRITEVHTPEGGIEHYTYDCAGNITSTTDANGGTITYRYNSMGQVCEIIDQEGNSETFYYDEEGRQEIHIDRKRNLERTLYNMDGNLFYQRFEDKNGKNPVVNQYLYDPNGRLKEANGGGITYRYAYTENGLLKSKSLSGHFLLEYAYDRNRNLARLTDRAGRIVHYTYDAQDRLEQVKDESGELLASYQYNPSGQLQNQQYGNGLHTHYQYEEDGSVSSLVTVTAQGQVLLNLDYAYDGNGNCTRKSGERYQNEYAYDRMNRLTEAVYDGEGERYTYDLAGNRLKKTAGGEREMYHYNAKNQLTSISTENDIVRYFYDLQGNLLEKQGRTIRKQYTYDTANRQRSIVSTGTAESKEERLVQFNHYDGEGLRYKTEENGKEISFLFDRGELVEEVREDAHISYVRGYAPICLRSNELETGYFVQDEVRSTLFILDGNQEIRKSYRYDAFGALRKEGGSSQNRLMYTGQMYDGAAGQYYLRARFYNPKIGRFMQEDVYRGDGLNLYAYCANNPVMYYDPSGYFGICPPNKIDQYKKDNSLDDPTLKKIYDKWTSTGITEVEALEYLQKYGSRPDVEYLPYIDQLADQAYQNVLAKKDYGLPPSMHELLESKPYLKDAFIGTAVDWEFKKLIRNSPYIPKGTYKITGQGLPGADLIFEGDLKGFKEEVWVDITTSKQANRHFGHYKNNGYVTAYR